MAISEKSGVGSRRGLPDRGTGLLHNKRESEYGCGRVREPVKGGHGTGGLAGWLAGVWVVARVNGVVWQVWRSLRRSGARV